MKAPKMPEGQICNVCNQKSANHLTLKAGQDKPIYRCCKCYILEGGYPAKQHPICQKTKTKMSKKAKEVFVRLGFKDIVVTKEESENGEYNTSASYLIGYEDAEGNECEEDGTYLNQNKEDE